MTFGDLEIGKLYIRIEKSNILRFHYVLDKRETRVHLLTFMYKSLGKTLEVRKFPTMHTDREVNENIRETRPEDRERLIRIIFYAKEFRLDY